MIGIVREKCDLIKQEIEEKKKQIIESTNEEIMVLKGNLERLEFELKSSEDMIKIYERDIKYYHMKLEIDKENIKSIPANQNHKNTSRSLLHSTLN